MHLAGKRAHELREQHSVLLAAPGVADRVDKHQFRADQNITVQLLWWLSLVPVLCFPAGPRPEARPRAAPGRLQALRVPGGQRRGYPQKGEPGEAVGECSARGAAGDSNSHPPSSLPRYDVNSWK